MSSAHSPEDVQSLHRRLRFASTSRFQFESFLSRFGLVHYRLLREIPLLGAKLAFDLFEVLRGRVALDHLGRANFSGLTAPVRLPQFPHYRGYWYDAERHSLVGMHVGLDLIFFQGKYYVVEINLGAAVKPGRRSLYQTRLDPIISTMIEIARQRNFRRVVLVRQEWTEEYIKEFQTATRESGIEVVGWSSRFEDQATRPSMTALPEPLEESTIYVVFTRLATALSHFIHHKKHSSQWLEETMKTAEGKTETLRCIPTYDRLIIPAQPSDPRWPNLVAKLASKDRGRFVAMGPFRSEEEACAALQLKDANDVPGIFEIGPFERMVDRVFPRLNPVYQPFIPPAILNGRACKTRLHVFISPLVDEFLSAHVTTAGNLLPSHIEPGKVDDSGAYNVSISVDGEYNPASPAEEEALHRTANEFGKVARLAITEKFETGPLEG